MKRLLLLVLFYGLASYGSCFGMEKDAQFFAFWPTFRALSEEYREAYESVYNQVITNFFGNERLPLQMAIKQYVEKGDVTNENTEKIKTYAEDATIDTLAYAIRNGYLLLAVLLINKGALERKLVDGQLVPTTSKEVEVTINDVRDIDGETILYHASFCKEFDMAETLLSCGADPNIPNNKGETPLMTAVKIGNFDLVRLLLEAGANPNSINEEGESALHYLSCVDDFEKIERINDSMKKQSLYQAIAFELLKHGAKIDGVIEKMDDGRKVETPLEYAVKKCRPELASMLTQMGALDSLSAKKRSKILRKFKQVCSTNKENKAEYDDRDPNEYIDRRYTVQDLIEEFDMKINSLEAVLDPIKYRAEHEEEEKMLRNFLTNDYKDQASESSILQNAMNKPERILFPEKEWSSDIALSKSFSLHDILIAAEIGGSRGFKRKVHFTFNDLAREIKEKSNSALCEDDIVMQLEKYALMPPPLENQSESEQVDEQNDEEENLEPELKRRKLN